MTDVSQIEEKGFESETKVSKAKKQSSQPVKSCVFDHVSMFDVFDFMHVKTQMKILKAQAAQEDEFGLSAVELKELMSSVPKRKKRKLGQNRSSSKKSKSSSGAAESPDSLDHSSSPSKKRDLRKVETKEVEEALKELDCQSDKKARAFVKTQFYVKSYMEKNPNVPVEKSHRKQLLQQQQQQNQKLISDARNDMGYYQQQFLQPKSAIAVTPISETITSASKDHISAINHWIQTNYKTLSLPQKKLVHMQLHYLNDLKKTTFQNESFVLNAQHLNNLNNLAFLNEHFQHHPQYQSQQQQQQQSSSDQTSEMN